MGLGHLQRILDEEVRSMLASKPLALIAEMATSVVCDIMYRRAGPRPTGR